MKQMVGLIKNFLKLPRVVREVQENNEDIKMLLGLIQTENVIRKTGYQQLAELEFKVYSQFGDDGIIQYLVHHIDLQNQTFIEFGVEDYLESNTRFLMQKNNWTGFIMDGTASNIERLKQSPIYWRHDLQAQAVFVTQDNINQLIADATKTWSGVDILHIDIDGNDYWIWQEIEINPAIVIMEYNANFGFEKALTIPYAADFYRTNAHYSNLYWGCSLKALYDLAMRKGYEFIGCNSAGNNAYFVRKDMMNENVRAVSLEKGFVYSKYRESRNSHGHLSYATPAQRTGILHGLPVLDIEANTIVPFGKA